eukprot:TRINITY_DN7246_c0_g1_i1.p2 TRINITY_DN7246_c0_g1~~TRINITY_DN7246_c0_g1_i1.p2  ORF type:complete len:231 (+),score=64.59 TRINITY_DN7246_c0_g1_i1:33-695(+)
MSLAFGYSSMFRLCGSLRQCLVISPMSSTVGKKPENKRPPNSFSLFWCSKMDNLPKGKEGLLEASRLWRAMTPSEKEPFVLSSRKRLEEYTKPPESETEIIERNIRLLKKKARRLMKEKKEILSGRILKRKLSPYNVFMGEAWRDGLGGEAASLKWKALSEKQRLSYERKAETLNVQRESAYESNPLSREEEEHYAVLSEKILKMKKEISLLEKTVEGLK